MSFLKRLSHQDFQIFAEVLHRSLKLPGKIVVESIEPVKQCLCLTTLRLDKNKLQFLSSDQSLKMRDIEGYCKKFNLDPIWLRQQLKLEWQAFLIGKFGAEYISKKHLFKASQTKVFAHVEKYSRVLERERKKQISQKEL